MKFLQKLKDSLNLHHKALLMNSKQKKRIRHLESEELLLRAHLRKTECESETLSAIISKLRIRLAKIMCSDSELKEKLLNEIKTVNLSEGDLVTVNMKELGIKW